MKNAHKTRILVVEDDNLFLWTLNHFLSKEGYEVCSVTTAESAFEIAQKQDFDIVISDFQLPGLNGKKLIQKVKELQPETKTILISAFQPEEWGNEEELLLNGYLNKPIELEMLKKLLQDITNVPGMTTP